MGCLRLHAIVWLQSQREGEISSGPRRATPPVVGIPTVGDCLTESQVETYVAQVPRPRSGDGPFLRTARRSLHRADSV